MTHITPSPAELVARLRNIGDHAIFEPSAYHDAASMIEALVKEKIAAIVLATQMIKEAESAAFTRGYAAGLEAGANVVDENTRDAFDEDVAAAIRALPIPQI